MSAAAFGMVPLLVLAGVWALLAAYDGDGAGRLRLTRIGVGCLVGAIALTALTVLLDDRHVPSSRTPTTTAPA